MVNETNLSSSDEDSAPETVSNPFGRSAANRLQVTNSPFGSGMMNVPQTVNNPFRSGVGNVPHINNNNPFGSGWDNPSQITNPLASGVSNIPQGNRPFLTRWGPPLIRPVAIEDGPVSPNEGLTNGHSHVNEWHAPHPTEFNPLYAPPDDETEEAEANPLSPNPEVVDQCLDEDEDLDDASDEDEEGTSTLYGNSQALEASLDAIMAEGNEADEADEADDFSDGDEDAYLDEA